MNLIWTAFLWFIIEAIAQDPGCDFYQRVAANAVYELNSPGYPGRYTGQNTCRWIAECPSGYNCRLECPLIEIPESTSCSLDRLLLSRSGDPQLAGAEFYCGRGSLSAVSTGQRMSIGLVTNQYTSGGRFQCTVSAQPATPTGQCSCGERKQNRIVGGEETGINEYKMMAGLVDARISQIKCGAVIISSNYVLTAAHCVKSMAISNLLVVVGEHNVDIGDSPATKLYRITNVIIHPLFTEQNYDYDIAILRVAGPIEFNDRVGPVCLPFKFVQKNFTNSKVTILGWGTVFVGGPDSKVLRKVDVDVISQSQCARVEPQVTPRQFCTLTPGKDSCQDDSGGPLLYTDPATGLLFNVGIVSFGRFCAEKDRPAINTKVTALLDWIVSNTQENYCVK